MPFKRYGVLLCLSDQSPTSLGSHRSCAHSLRMAASCRAAGPHVHACVIAPARRQAGTPSSKSRSNSSSRQQQQQSCCSASWPCCRCSCAFPPALSSTSPLHTHLWLQSADCCASQTASLAGCCRRATEAQQLCAHVCWGLWDTHAQPSSIRLHRNIQAAGARLVHCCVEGKRHRGHKHSTSCCASTVQCMAQPTRHSPHDWLLCAVAVGAGQ